MSKIIRDIEGIIILARNILKQLKKGKINKSKKELNLIINLNIDELRRIQKEGGDKRLLEECVVVINQAKRALRDLNSFELSDEVKELIDRIIVIERHELLEAKEDEREEDELYDFWFQNFYNAVLYHGTKDILMQGIDRYGLTTYRKPYDPYDLKRLNQIIQSLGLNPIGGKYLRTETIWLTLSKSGAIAYAKDHSPEIVRAVLGTIKDIMVELNIGRISLDKEVIRELNRMKIKYQQMYKKTKPVLITIKITSPTILETIDDAWRKIITNFNFYKEEMLRIKKEYGQNKEFFYEELFLKNFGELKIYKRIPRKEIMSIELLS